MPGGRRSRRWSPATQGSRSPHRTLTRCLALVLVLCCGQTDAASLSGLPADQLWEAYAERWASTRTYTASFTQRIEIAGIGGPVTSKGRFYFARPDRLRWDYLEGQIQTVVGDGTWIWIYQPDLKQAYRIDYSMAFGAGGLVPLLAGREGLSSRYVLTAMEKQGRLLKLGLVPKEHPGERIELLVSAEKMDLEKARISDPAGSVTTVEFSGSRRNEALADTLFVFTPPKGVDVIASQAGPP